MKRQTRGVTLVELLVSIGITVAMLLMTSVVFKSSTEASGRAMARGEIMHQLRAITRQLDQDFTGLRPDMPLAIIFEEDATDLVRQDRIWFFANGDFQSLDATVSGNIARIFYGQSEDARPVTNEDPGLNLLFLLRRQKILTADLSSWFAPSSPEEYDIIPIDQFGNLALWKNIPFADWQNFYFRNDSGIAFSIIRRSNVFDIITAINDTSNAVEQDALQRQYLISDVTDFKVEVWFAGAAEWFPNATDWETIASDGLTLPNLVDGYAFYWNAPEDPTPSPYGETVIPVGLEWRGESALNRFLASGNLGWTNTWPEALRFTFTLYDKNRRHFPDGETFSYIVKLPGR